LFVIAYIAIGVRLGRLLPNEMIVGVVSRVLCSDVMKEVCLVFQGIEAGRKRYNEIGSTGLRNGFENRVKRFDGLVRGVFNRPLVLCSVLLSSTSPT
jgi:hypothetical protein